MSQVAAPDKSVSQAGTLPLLRATVRFARIIPPLLLGLSAVLTAPWFLSTYNIDRARRAMEAGVQWPEPRLVDSLPAVRDTSEAEKALAHLAAALRWNPRNAYAHRLAAQVYVAQGQLVRAVQELEQAQSLAALDPLVVWEQALVYEQMARVVARAPRENILPDLASVPIDAPAQPIDTVYCGAGPPQSCYVGLDRYTQAYAAVPDGLPITADVLFMHPPAGVHLTYFVDRQRPALQFLLGLDPGVRTWDTDGATFQVWLTAEGQARTLVFEQTLDRAAARKGWHPGWADLSAWAGQSVTIELRTTGGPAENTANDWYAWGNVALTTREAGQLAMLAPVPRMREAFAAVVTDQSTFVKYGDARFEQLHFESAQAWYERALILRDEDPSLQFRAAVASTIANHALPSLVNQTGVEIHSVDDAVHIAGATLQWMRSLPEWNLKVGDPLRKHTRSNESVGLMPWAGAAVAFVQIRDAGSYQLTVRALDNFPPPTALQIEHNLHPIAPIDLPRGDMSWQERRVELFLAPGAHLIGVHFLNDNAAYGLNRDAVVDWIRIERKK